MLVSQKFPIMHKKKSIINLEINKFLIKGVTTKGSHYFL